METSYFKRPEGTLAYSDYVSGGEPVLMLPGMGALRSEYRFLAPVLSETGFRAVTVDLRGQGESSVPWKTYDVPSIGSDIIALINHLNAGPAHVIATSFAPAAAVWAAVEFPDKVRSLVLISPFVRETKISPIKIFLFWLMMNNPWRVKLWGMYYRTLYPAQKPDDFHEYLRQLMDNLSQRGRFDAVSKIGSASREPSQGRLQLVKVPVLVIMGTKDADFSDPAQEGKIVAGQTGGMLALVEGAGHYPQTEMPSKTIPLIVDFLQTSAL